MGLLAEAVAVALGVAYLLLATRENRLCWVAGGASALLFLLLFARSGLAGQALLQGYYLAMAVYGWRYWYRLGNDSAALTVTRCPRSWHLLALLLVTTATLLTVLPRHAPEPAHWLDAATSWGSVVTTWLAARKVLEHWLYWIVIDAFSAVLYLDRGLLLTAALFAAYCGLALRGWWLWRRHCPAT